VKSYSHSRERMRQTVSTTAQSEYDPSSREPSELKARQMAKIKEVCAVLIEAGYTTLDEQAKALGLPRSTAWTILRTQHKNSGLSATTINRVLSAPRLPAVARDKIFEYIEEKSASLYGHTKVKLRRFTERLTAKRSRSTKDIERKL
jgi:hypothetical protein